MTTEKICGIVFLICLPIVLFAALKGVVMFGRCISGIRRAFAPRKDQ